MKLIDNFSVLQFYLNARPPTCCTLGVVAVPAGESRGDAEQLEWLLSWECDCKWVKEDVELVEAQLKRG